MTNDEMIQDLKQFIQATVHQEAAQSEERLSARIDDKIDGLRDELVQVEHRLDAKLDEIQEGIADTLTKSIETVDTQSKSRITSSAFFG